MAKNVPVGYVDFVLNITRSGDAEPFAITFGGKVDSGPFTLANTEQVGGAAGAELGELLLSGDTMTQITAYVANDGPPNIFQANINVAGDWTGNPLPSNCAAIITKLTGMGGRWNKGRCFFPSVSEAQVDANGIIAGAIRTAYTDRFETFRQDVTVDDPTCNLSDLVIFHDESLEMLPTPIVQFSCESKIGTQRRRLRR